MTVGVRGEGPGCSSLAHPQGTGRTGACSLPYPSIFVRDEGAIRQLAQITVALRSAPELRRCAHNESPVRPNPDRGFSFGPGESQPPVSAVRRCCVRARRTGAAAATAFDLTSDACLTDVAIAEMAEACAGLRFGQPLLGACRTRRQRRECCENCKGKDSSHVHGLPIANRTDVHLFIGKRSGRPTREA
jgi:hypothetical protein